MSRYRMQDGTVIDTEKAAHTWRDETDWDGRNMIHRSTGQQARYQTLYRSRKGRYYIEHNSNWQGEDSHVEWVSPEEAARWLLYNEYELPDDLQQYAEQLVE